MNRSYHMGTKGLRSLDCLVVGIRDNQVEKTGNSLNGSWYERGMWDFLDLGGPFQGGYYRDIKGYIWARKEST